MPARLGKQEFRTSVILTEAQLKNVRRAIPQSHGFYGRQLTDSWKGMISISRVWIVNGSERKPLPSMTLRIVASGDSNRRAQDTGGSRYLPRIRRAVIAAGRVASRGVVGGVGAVTTLTLDAHSIPRARII
jgi:hypothetical protein